MSHDHPFDRVLRALRARGCRVSPKRDSKGREAVRANCPAHDDRKPSLVVTRDGSRVLLHCFGGCPGDNKKVVAALGLTIRDLFSGPAVPSRIERIEATYDYYNRAGSFIGQKVRYEGKRFRWRRLDKGPKGGWMPGLLEAPGLYRFRDLGGASTVYVTEGEKSADLLWSLGLPATCPPSGASSWKAEWSIDLLESGCRHLIVLADRDAAGQEHAERVARTTATMEGRTGIRVQVVQFPDLPMGADVHDYLASHNPPELLALVEATPSWTPELVVERRRERVQALRRARNRRYRDRIKSSRLGMPHIGAGATDIADIRSVSLDGSDIRHVSDATVKTRDGETAPNVLPDTSQKSFLQESVDDGATARTEIESVATEALDSGLRSEEELDPAWTAIGPIGD